MPSSPFPGMNPYLEQPVFWSEFHNRLIVSISDALTPSLRPKYYIGVETRTYLDESDEELLAGIADAVVLSATRNQAPPLTSQLTGVTVQSQPIEVQLPMLVEVKQRYLEVREVGTDAVITVIEVLSPKNKRKGQGRDLYEKKRQKVLRSLSHLVEIDLLRSDLPMAMIGTNVQTHYRILVSRASKRPTADLYGFNLQEAIPTFPLPLKPEDQELIVDLQEIFAGVYNKGSYDLRIDYQQPIPNPALSPLDQQWVDALLAPFR